MTRRPKTIDKSVLALPEPRRVRDRDNVRHVAKQACLVCGRLPSDDHHLHLAQNRALGRKVSDEFTIPLCRGHHREVHRCGDEAAWWSKTGIDPTVTARTLWLETHPLALSVQIGINGADPVLADGSDRSKDKRERPGSGQAGWAAMTSLMGNCESACKKGADQGRIASP